MTRRGAEVAVSFLKRWSPRRKTISPALRRRRSSGTSSLRRACCIGVRSSETDISRPRRAVQDLSVVFDPLPFNTPHTSLCLKGQTQSRRCRTTSSSQEHRMSRVGSHFIYGGCHTHTLRTLILSAGELSLIRNIGDSGFREFRSVSTSTGVTDVTFRFVSKNEAMTSTGGLPR